MKKSQDKLFELINSLTKAEKQRFRLFANYYSSGDKKYLRLFELIAAQKKYNENSIKKKLLGEKIITTLPRLKNYLLDLILKSLRLHYSGKSVEAQLRDLFADFETCYRKGLKNLYDKQLKKAKKLAHGNEKYEAHLSALNKELLFSHPATINIFDEHKRVRQQIEEQNEYSYLFFKTRQLVKQGLVRDERLKNEWDKIIQMPLMDKDKVPAGFEESYNYYRIWMLYHEGMENFEKCSYYQELIIAKLELQPEKVKENLVRYMSELNNLILSSGVIKKSEKAKETMDKLLEIQNRELNPLEKHQLNNYIIVGYSNLIDSIIYSKQFNELAPVTAQAELFVQANKSDSYYKSALYANLTVSHLVNGNYEQSLFWNNLFLKEPVASYLENVHAVCRVLNLILHYELRNFDLVPYINRSTYRFLYKRKRLYKTEDTVLSFIRNKIPKTNSSKELIEAFNELKSELEEITKDPYEAKALEYFDFIIWLESKIENRSFAEISSERALQKNS